MGWDTLFTYQAEVARGLIHSPQWQAKMELEQAEFDFEKDRNYRKGRTEFVAGRWQQPVR